MKNKNIPCFLILLFTSLLFSSCIQQLILRSMGVFENAVPLKYITNGDKKLIFFPIHHVGKKEFYSDVKNKIDSLRLQGFEVYYELVQLGNIRDSLQRDTIYLKARKITGIDFATANQNKGYIDTINNTILGEKNKFILKYNLVNQTRDIIPTFDSLRVKNVDGNFVNLLQATEDKFGKITLEKYDFETKFGEKYKVKENKEMKKFFVEEYRNDLITKSILNDKHNKIILVYGKAHFEGFLKNLKLADPNFKEVDKF